MKKIIMLVDNPLVSDARVEKEAKSLVQAGFEVTIVAVKTDQTDVEESRDGYLILRIMDFFFNSPLRKEYAPKEQALIQKITALNGDFIHCHDFYMLTIGAKIKQLHPRIQLIYDSHEYLVGWPFYHSNKGLLNKIKGYIVWRKLISNERKTIQIADIVLTITTSIAEKLQHNNRLKKLPEVIYNYPEKINLSEKSHYFHEKYSIPLTHKIIVHTGTIYHTDAQLEKLFQNIYSTPNCALIFIGNRPRFDEVQKMVSQKKELATKVFFHSYPANQQEVIQLLHQADIGLLHVRNKWEAHKIGFSNRFVEYILAELPVIGTPQDYTKEINQTNQCCTFYEENNASSFQLALNKLLTNYDEHFKNLQKAKKLMNWESEEKKLSEIYTQINN